MRNLNMQEPCIGSPSMMSWLETDGESGLEVDPPCDAPIASCVPALRSEDHRYYTESERHQVLVSIQECRPYCNCGIALAGRFATSQVSLSGHPIKVPVNTYTEPIAGRGNFVDKLDPSEVMYFIICVIAIPIHGFLCLGLASLSG